MFWITRKIIKIIAILAFLIAGSALFFYFRFTPTQNPAWGLTFSYQEAQGLGFDWKIVYADILSDLKPQNLRLMTYWNDVEKEKGKYDFSIADYMVSEAAKQNVNIILAVGHKQPRWPECHHPDWFNKLSKDEADKAVVDFVAATINHFKSNTAIKEWQVENEPFFGFGPDCPTSSEELLKAEITKVKELDQRPILTTDSGDRGGWLSATKSGATDFGYTLYRVSYDKKYGGYYKYPLPPSFYRVRSGILRTFTDVKQISDVELQMEPWFTNGATNTPVDVQKTLMNQKVFEDNIAYAKKTGAASHYLWGVEWWYWMAKKQGDWGMWTAAKNLFRPT